ncbi:helix-turn-helix domain-containing protein [Streptococcus sp. SGI.013]|uniref:helix-turn-helix domain-containing protein n=1 Tax=unclassified Streptococcus TaxID=2608887 RepID=UPI003CFCC661
MKRIGDVLRETRVKQGLTLEDIYKKTRVPQAYLLAMELNNFEALPKDEEEQALSRYAEILNLDFDYLMQIEREYQAERSSLMLGDETALTLAEATKQTERHFKERSSRTGSKNQNPSYYPLIILGTIASLILVFVLYMILQQVTSIDSSDSSSSFSSSQVVTSGTSSQQTSSSTESPTPTLSVEGGGDTLTVTAKNMSQPITIEVSLDGASEAWFSVTNADIDEAGIILGEGYSSHTVTLQDGVSNAVISLGSANGISVKIGGQAVDLSGLSATDASYITLNIE